MFIAAWCPRWQPLKCPLIDDWIMKKLAHVYTGMLLRHKKRYNTTIRDNTDGP